MLIVEAISNAGRGGSLCWAEGRIYTLDPLTPRDGGIYKTASHAHTHVRKTREATDCKKGANMRFIPRDTHRSEKNKLNEGPKNKSNL